jgi:hypothetical protein
VQGRLPSNYGCSLEGLTVSKKVLMEIEDPRAGKRESRNKRRTEYAGKENSGEEGF